MIDWTRVKDLKEEVGEEDFSEIVEIFLEEVEEVVERLETKSYASLEADLHFLKGSALNLGFEALSKLCQTGETAAAAGDEFDVTPVIGTYRQSRAEFTSQL